MPRFISLWTGAGDHAAFEQDYLSTQPGLQMENGCGSRIVASTTSVVLAAFFIRRLPLPPIRVRDRRGCTMGPRAGRPPRRDRAQSRPDHTRPLEREGRRHAGGSAPIRDDVARRVRNMEVGVRLEVVKYGLCVQRCSRSWFEHDLERHDFLLV
jgi:hypothetical protein